jgi:hypothetical protein
MYSVSAMLGSDPFKAKLAEFNSMFQVHCDVQRLGYLKFPHDEHKTSCIKVLLHAPKLSRSSPSCICNLRHFLRSALNPPGGALPQAPSPRPLSAMEFMLSPIYQMTTGQHEYLLAR